MKITQDMTIHGGCPDGFWAKSNCHYMKLTDNCRHREYVIPEPVPPPTGANDATRTH